MIYFWIACAVVFSTVVAWNMLPALRAKMRGYSTIIEGALGVGLTYFGMVTDALQEASAAGYVPDGLEKYIPAIVFVWILLKRFQTTTPVGQKDA